MVIIMSCMFSIRLAYYAVLHISVLYNMGLSENRLLPIPMDSHHVPYERAGYTTFPDTPI